MTESGSPLPNVFRGDLRDPDLPILREHFRDVTRWVIGDAVGDRLTAGESDALAEEIAVILASGLASALRREVEYQAEKTVAGLQKGPVSFDYYHQLQVDGFPVEDLVRLLDAVGRLVDAGVNETISGLHETHRHMLYRAHDSWRAKHGEPDGSD
ncbi:MAG: hypothetical protein HOV87_03560 [Catenulispora sp.]|nr:hypothetical protein [Catenulispora sp.]